LSRLEIELGRLGDGVQANDLYRDIGRLRAASEISSTEVDAIRDKIAVAATIPQVPVTGSDKVMFVLDYIRSEAQRHSVTVENVEIANGEVLVEVKSLSGERPVSWTLRDDGGEVALTHHGFDGESDATCLAFRSLCRELRGDVPVEEAEAKGASVGVAQRAKD
jgi:hypothetical protein